MSHQCPQIGASPAKAEAGQTPVRFMIVAQARSGSTLLREALNDESDITCHGDVFSRVWIDRLVPRPNTRRPTPDQIRAQLPARDADPLRFMAEYVMPFTGAAVGFKIIYDDFVDNRFLHPLSSYARQNRMRIVHLRRLNPVAALASRTRMSRFGIAHSDMAQRPGTRPPPEKILIKPNELARYIERQKMLAQRIDAIFPDALQARYETLRDDYPRILAHLGLPDGRPFHAPLRKMAPRHMRDIIQNYDEIGQYDQPEQPNWQ